MDSPENQPENQPIPENSQNSAPVNTVAETITPAELLPKRKGGRPKGAKDSKPRKKPAEKTPENPPLNPDQFVSQIPGEPGSAVSDPSQPSPGMENAPGAPVSVDYRGNATLMVGMGTGALAMMLGPEWEPENEAEKNGLIIAVEEYLKTTNAPDIPPSAMLLLVIAMYSSKRINKPSTSGKLKMAWLWMKSKFTRRKKTPAPVSDFQPSVVNGGAQ